MGRPGANHRTLAFTTIEVPLAGGRSTRLAGVTPHDAAGFISAANEAFRTHFLKQFEAAQSELTAPSELIARLGQPRRYPAACLLSPVLSRTTAIINALPATIPDGVLSEEQQQLIATVRAFQEHPDEVRRAAIERLIDSDLADMKGFFDTIEKNPLTPEQRLAVVTDKEAALVLAGASSSKTSLPTPFRAAINCQAIYNPSRGLCLSAAGPAMLALCHEFDRTGDFP